MKTVLEINNYNGQLQKPLASGFNARSTADDVIKGIDLTGKVAIVTGGNTGIYSTLGHNDYGALPSNAPRKFGSVKW